MNILLITDSFVPEIRSSSILMTDLARGLRDKGHKIFVLTCVPKYNLADNLSEEKSAEEQEIRVIRVKTLPIHKVGKYVRGVGELCLPCFFSRAAKKYIKDKIDIIFVYSPPLSLGILGKKLKKYFKAKLIVNIQDIFPQNAVDLGVIKKGLVKNFFEKMEKKVYRGADLITVHSQGNKEFLVNKKQVPAEKIEIVPNWIDSQPFDRAVNRGEFRKKWGLENKFVVLFAGVIGPAQGLDFVIETAKEIQDKDIVFLFVGNGTEKENLKKMAKRFFSNVLFKSFVDPQAYPYLLKEVDVGLVCLSKKVKTPVVPGKIAGYMASGLPILAVLNKESDGHELIQKSGCGFSVISGDKKEFLRALFVLKNNPVLRKEMIEKGKKYFKENFSREKCLDKYEKLFYNLIAKPKIL